MKTISKRFLKGGLAVLLAVLMLFGSTLTGFAAVVDNADTSANVDVAQTGYKFSSGTIVYFDSTDFGWPSNYVVEFMIGHNTWSATYQMTKISNTNLYYYKFSGDWDNCTQYCIIANASAWGDEGNSPSHRRGYASYKTSLQNINGNYSGTFLVTKSNESCVHQGSAYSSVNKTQTIYVVSTAAGGTTYSNDANAGTVKLTGRYLSAATTASSRTIQTTLGSSYSANDTFAPGATMTLTATANTGYTFKGWYNDPSGGSLLSSSASYTTTHKGSSNNYYARFEKAPTYTATFEDWDGKNLKTQSGLASGTTPTAPANPTREGYTFKGWDPAVGAISADTTYTATYTKNNYNVTFSENGGTGTVSANPTSATMGDSVSITVTPPDGKKISSITGGGLNVGECESYTGSITMPAQNVTITVTYVDAIQTYTASAQAYTNKVAGTYGGTVKINGSPSPIQLAKDNLATFNATPNENYTFFGWYNNDQFTGTPVSTELTYTEKMTENGIQLYALFVKDFYIHSGEQNIAKFTYDLANDTYTTTSNFVSAFKIVSNDGEYVPGSDVKVFGNAHKGVTVGGHESSYGLTPDLENYTTEEPVTYTLNPAAISGTYNMIIELQEADKYKVYVGEEEVAQKAAGVPVTIPINPPVDTKYLASATATPATNLTIGDNKITFEMPTQDIYITPAFLDYRYISFTAETGLDIQGKKTAYKQGEEVNFTVAPSGDSVTISAIESSNAAISATKGDNGVWTISGNMPADVDVKLTPTVDAKFKMDYGMVAIGNYGSGYTTYGTVAMNIDGTALSKGGYVDKTETVTYTATPNTNFIFDGWYSGESCETSQLLSRETSYDVTPTEDTTIYALFVPKHYIAEDQANVSSYQEMTYDPATRTFHYSSSTISKSAWFRVSNRPETSYWTDSSSYCIFDSSFNVTFNANAYMVTVGWGSQCYALTSDSSAEHPYEIIVALNGNSSIDVSCKAAVDGIGSVFLSSGRGDIVEATSIFTTEGITAVDKNAHHDGTADSIHESYKVANLQEPQTVSFETELTGVNAGNYYIDRYVVYHVNTETYTLITPNTLGNNKYSGTVYVDGPCYIVPIYFLTPEYTAANGLVEIDIYFDATAIKDKNWGPFVACYAWGSNNTKYTGGWSGQLMIPNEDGSSFYTMIAVPDGVTNESSVPNGVTFNNYMQATVPGHNAGAFGISATQYQCYDYREPITLYEEGYDVITFVAKESTDGYHGDRANGVTVNTVTASTTDIFNKYDFDYLYNRNGDVPMDLNGDDIENPVNISVARADYYIIAKGDITYDPNGTKYTADPAFDADWAVDWYVFDSNGTYVTNILSDAMYNEYADDGTTFLENALGLTAAQAAGKTIAISYDHENNAGHQISYDGQWYGNTLDQDVNAKVMVGLQDANGNFVIDTEDPTNDAIYGDGWLVAEEEREGYTVGEKYAELPISLDHGSVALNANTKDGYRFVGWYTEANGNYTQISNAFDYSTYINLDTTYYAIFREIAQDEVVINHMTYNNPDDPSIPSHGGVSTMTVEVKNSAGEVVASGTPSNDRTTAVFEATEGTYTVTITTTPLMNGKFFAWYGDAVDADGNATYEEIGTDGSNVGQTTKQTFTFYYDFTPTSPRKINLYSDVTRVSNKAILQYKYLNRFDEWRTYTVRDVELNDNECLGYAGNDGKAYYPTYITMYKVGDTWVTEEGLNGSEDYTETRNLVQQYAPSANVTEAFDKDIEWVIEDAYIDSATTESVFVLRAKEDVPTYTITYTIGNETNTQSGIYNTLADIQAPLTNDAGEKFLYWAELKDTDGDGEKEEVILTYLPNYQYRIVENKEIIAVYGTETLEKWTPSIDSVTYTREFGDNGDYIYTDYLISYNSSEALKIEDIKDSGVKYGLILARDPSVAYSGSGEKVFPAVNEDTVDNFKTVAQGDGSVNIDGINYYYYDLTSYETTNLNRLDYFLKYDNNYTNKSGVKYCQYCFTAVAYIIVDGEVYLSAPQNVNFYDLANTATTPNA